MDTIDLQCMTARKPSRRHWASLIISLVVFFCLASPVWSADSIEQWDSKIGPGVLEELRSSGAADVMIALVNEPAFGSNSALESLDPAAVREWVAPMQSSVLAGLSQNDFQTTIMFSAVPALAGRILSEAGLTALASHPSVLKIDLDVGGTGSLASSVPFVGGDLRHELGNTGAGIVVAVLDSGIDTDHVNLGDNLIHQACFLDADGSINGFGLCPNGSDRQTGVGSAEDDAGHGTHVTGIITSNGSLGSAGVAPDASIVSIKVTAGPSFSGRFFAFSEIVAALDYIINNPSLGVQVINMSLVTSARFTGDCDASAAFNMAGAAAINTLRANGVISFASAGNNSSPTQMTSPACLSNVISVGASDNNDTAAGFTNSNASTDVFAPGVSIFSSNLSNGTTTASGTSMASPIAAGCAALLIQNGEVVTPDQIETRLESSPRRVVVSANGLSFPRVDCRPLGADGKDPTIPGGFRYEVYSDTAAELFWNRSTDDGRVVGYDITRNGVLVETRDATSYYDDNLNPGDTYNYVIAAVDNEGNRSTTDSVRVTASRNSVPSGVPTAPSGFRFAVYSDTAAELFWNRSTDDGRVVGYDIVRNGVLVETRDATSYFDDSLSPGTNYIYRIVAVDDEGNRSGTSTVSFKTGENPTPLGNPSIPSGFRFAVYSNTAAELFWNRSTDEGRIVGYDITRNGVLVETRDATSYFDDSLSSGTTYIYRIVAVDDEGNRSPSNTVSVSTDGGK